MPPDTESIGEMPSTGVPTSPGAGVGVTVGTGVGVGST